jgi:hypothetical protein
MHVTHKAARNTMAFTARLPFHLVLGVLLASLFLNVAYHGSPALTQPPSRSAITPPTNGCYVGVFPGWGDLEDTVESEQLTAFEQLAGKGVAAVPFSNFWGEQYTSLQQLNEIASAGAIPLLRLMPWGEPYWEPFAYQPDYSLQRIIDGDFDTFLTEWADELKLFAQPAMLTFGVEMNGNWFAWSGVFQGGSTTTGYGDPARADGPERYVDAYRHIIDLFRSQGVTNVAWLFHPNHESWPDEAWNSIEAYYPGDSYIDWVGASVYGAMWMDDPWVTFEDVMDPIYTLLTTNFPNKPLMIPEWGVREGDTPTQKATWYTDALTTLETTYTRIKIAIVYHERFETAPGPWVDLRINSSTEALSAYQGGISSDYFLGEWETSTTPPTPLPLPPLLLVGVITILVVTVFAVFRRRQQSAIVRSSLARFGR